MPRRKGAAKAAAERREKSVRDAIALARRNVRVHVLARTEDEAIRIGRGKPWWPQVLTGPVRDAGNSFTFVIAG